MYVSCILRQQGSQITGDKAIKYSVQSMGQFKLIQIVTEEIASVKGIKKRKINSI